MQISELQANKEDTTTQLSLSGDRPGFPKQETAEWRVGNSSKMVSSGVKNQLSALENLFPGQQLYPYHADDGIKAKPELELLLHNFWLREVARNLSSRNGFSEANKSNRTKNKKKISFHTQHSETHNGNFELNRMDRIIMLNQIYLNLEGQFKVSRKQQIFLHGEHNCRIKMIEKSHLTLMNKKIKSRAAKNKKISRKNLTHSSFSLSRKPENQQSSQENQTRKNNGVEFFKNLRINALFRGITLRIRYDKSLLSLERKDKNHFIYVTFYSSHEVGSLKHNYHRANFPYHIDIMGKPNKSNNGGKVDDDKSGNISDASASSGASRAMQTAASSSNSSTPKRKWNDHMDSDLEGVQPLQESMSKMIKDLSSDMERMKTLPLELNMNAFNPPTPVDDITKPPANSQETTNVETEPKRMEVKTQPVITQDPMNPALSPSITSENLNEAIQKAKRKLEELQTFGLHGSGDENEQEFIMKQRRELREYEEKIRQQQTTISKRLLNPNILLHNRDKSPYMRPRGNRANETIQGQNSFSNSSSNATNDSLKTNFDDNKPHNLIALPDLYPTVIIGDELRIEMKQYINTALEDRIKRNINFQIKNPTMLHLSGCLVFKCPNATTAQWLNYIISENDWSAFGVRFSIQNFSEEMLEPAYSVWIPSTTASWEVAISMIRIGSENTLNTAEWKLIKTMDESGNNGKNMMRGKTFTFLGNQDLEDAMGDAREIKYDYNTSKATIKRFGNGSRGAQGKTNNLKNRSKISNEIKYPQQVACVKMQMRQSLEPNGLRCKMDSLPTCVRLKKKGTKSRRLTDCILLRASIRKPEKSQETSDFSNTNCHRCTLKQRPSQKYPGKTKRKLNLRCRATMKWIRKTISISPQAISSWKKTCSKAKTTSKFPSGSDPKATKKSPGIKLVENFSKTASLKFKLLSFSKIIRINATATSTNHLENFITMNCQIRNNYKSLLTFALFFHIIKSKTSLLKSNVTRCIKIHSGKFEIHSPGSNCIIILQNILKHKILRGSKSLQGIRSRSKDCNLIKISSFQTQNKIMKNRCCKENKKNKESLLNTAMNVKLTCASYHWVGKISDDNG